MTDQLTELDIALIPVELPPTPTSLPAARAGDFMRLADSLRAALELVDLAADRLERRYGTTDRVVVTLRSQAARLRARP